jgi:hypothetical protein
MNDDEKGNSSIVPIAANAGLAETSTRCWICDDVADSGEHRIKASDLKMMFGKVHNAHPLYMHVGDKRNERVAGLQSDKLKYKRVICRGCNGTRTQVSDMAWQTLSQNLQARGALIADGTLIRLAKIFPGDVNQKMQSVHLFFVKQFGCMIAENDIPIDLSGFSSAVLQNKPHADVYLRFLTGFQHSRYRVASRTPLNAIEENGIVRFASWIYMLDRIAVNVLYVASPKYRDRLPPASYHPSHGTRVIRFFGPDS